MSIQSDFGRLALRAAAKIHERLHVPARLNCVDRFPGAEWDRLRNTLWRHRKVEVRDWRVAARALLDDLDYQTGLLISQLQCFRQQLTSSARAKQVAAPSQILADLLALDNEFESVEIDLQEKTVTVQTAPIELEDLWLGPFDIRLWWERLGVRRAYEVIAKRPQHPSRDESVTHPHVRDKQLCEGDGATPIRMALDGGQIFDFFLVVRQTLETYNSSSPYVSIEEWNGFRCPDCGCGLNADEASYCDRCDDRVCNECSIWCRSCDQSFCSSCTGQCAECEEPFCEVCLTKDARTLRLLCKSCQTRGVPTENDDDQVPIAPPADAVCMGQTVAAA
jgi:hypothetical protein